MFYLMLQTDMCLSNFTDWYVFIYISQNVLFLDEIMERIREAGFHIAARKETDVTMEIAKEFYKDVADKPYFDELTEHMTS